tara:strand:+ start:376 stop:1473 length:1098 start_codon:yes stop_codon:yes gene_type:complete
MSIALPPEFIRVPFYEWVDEKKYVVNPIERPYKKRAKRSDVIERFNPWQSIHYLGHCTTLMNDDVDEVSGIRYKKGTVFKLDMHTRPQVIINGDSDATADLIDKNGGFYIGKQVAQNIKEVKRQYKQHDSTGAVEKRSDAMFSAFYSAYLDENSPQPDNPAFMKSQPLSYAAHYTYGYDHKTKKGFISDSGLDQETLSYAVKAFMPYFDKLEPITFNTKKKKQIGDMGNVCSSVVWDSWLYFASLMVGHKHQWSDSWFKTVLDINNANLQGYDWTKRKGSTALALLVREWDQSNASQTHPDKRLNKGQLKTSLIDQLFYLFDMAIDEPNRLFKTVTSESKGYFENFYKFRLDKNHKNTLDGFFNT